MTEPTETFEHAGVTVEIVPDLDPSDPQDNDNAGTIYSWARDFAGDEHIYCRDTISGRPYELSNHTYETTGVLATRRLFAYFREHYDAVLTIPLYYSAGSYAARLYEDTAEDANAVICFTRDELDREWAGKIAAARRYAKARVGELDDWLRGNVYGIVIRHPKSGEVLDSCWGFIGDLYGESGKYIYEQANEMADACAEQIAREKTEVAYWAARDVVTEDA